jgi:hypothetical protein
MYLERFGMVVPGVKRVGCVGFGLRGSAAPEGAVIFLEAGGAAEQFAKNYR